MSNPASVLPVSSVAAAASHLVEVRKEAESEIRAALTALASGREKWIRAQNGLDALGVQTQRPETAPRPDGGEG